MSGDLPPEVREAVGNHDIAVFSCPPVASTDEAVRRRRAHFGTRVFPVAVLIEHEGKFVLVRYAQDPRPRGWTVPGGYAEPGESLRAAALRETDEECGLDIELERPLGVATTAVTSPSEGGLDYYLTIFQARSKGGTLGRRDRNEIDEVLLAPFDEIEVLAAAGHFPSINGILEMSIVECLRRYQT